MNYQQLNGISCTSASFCLAVGASYGCCGLSDGIALAWDGSSWTSVSGGAVLSGVSCTRATSCLAVGAVSSSDNDVVPFLYAAVERWNGSSLTALGGAPVIHESSLGGVSCTRANWCAAVGSFTTHGGAILPLVERWNGTTLNRMWAPG
jgi:hypothetical protein